MGEEKERKIETETQTETETETEKEKDREKKYEIGSAEHLLQLYYGIDEHGLAFHECTLSSLSTVPSVASSGREEKIGSERIVYEYDWERYREKATSWMSCHVGDFFLKGRRLTKERKTEKMKENEEINGRNKENNSG